MVSIQLTFVQMLIAIVVAIIAFVAGSKVVQILLKIIFSSAPVLMWNQRRQLEQQKVAQKTQKQIMHDKIKAMSDFVEMIKHDYPSYQQKQIFKDFIDGGKSRDYWIKTLLEFYAPEEKKDPKGTGAKDGV